MQPVPKCCSVFAKTKRAKVAAKAQDVETVAVTVVAAAAVRKLPVVTAAVAAVVVMAAAKAGAVANTMLHVLKAHVVLKDMAVAVVVKAVHAHPWVTHNPAATKVDLEAAWASALPAAHQAVNLTLCAPVSI